MRTAEHPPGAKHAARRRKPAWGKLIAFAIAIAALAAVWRFTPLSEYLTQQRVADWARAVRAREWAPVAVVLAYTPAAFLMFPRPLLTLFAVVAFGPWRGFVYGMAGILLSAIAAYFAGRAVSPETVRKLGGDKVDHVTEVLRDHGIVAVFGMRIVPLAPHSVESMIAGAARINLAHFLAGTFAGMLPGVLTTTVFGGEIASALEDPSKINYGLVAAAAVAFAAFSFFVGRWFMRQHHAR